MNNNPFNSIRSGGRGLSRRVGVSLANGRPGWPGGRDVIKGAGLKGSGAKVLHLYFTRNDLPVPLKRKIEL